MLSLCQKAFRHGLVRPRSVAFTPSASSTAIIPAARSLSSLSSTTKSFAAISSSSTTNANTQPSSAPSSAASKASNNTAHTNGNSTEKKEQGANGTDFLATKPLTAEEQAMLEDEEAIRESILNLELSDLNITTEEIDFTEVDGMR